MNADSDTFIPRKRKGLNMKRSKTKLTVDESIIEMLFARNEAGIDKMRSTYERSLTHFGKNLLRDKRDIEECLWDTYMAAWQAIPPNRPSSLLGYLCTIFRRKAIDLVRKRARQKRGAGTADIPWESCEELVGSEQDLDQILENKRALAIVEAYLSALPDRDAAIFIGKFYLGQTMEELASDLFVSRTTVNVRLASMRKELQKKLREEGIEK